MSNGLKVGLWNMYKLNNYQNGMPQIEENVLLATLAEMNSQKIK